MNNNSRFMILCEGRHDIPESQKVNGFVFENTLNTKDLTNPTQLEKIATDKLNGCKRLYLTVTGLSVALVSVINACRKLNIDLTLLHYDKVTGVYYKQKVY